MKLLVDRTTGLATPSFDYAKGDGSIATVTGDPINLAGTTILQAIQDSYVNQGQASGLAVGLWSTNDPGETGATGTFSATFDYVHIQATGAPEQLLRAVNAGGGQFTASNGVTYEADNGSLVSGPSDVFSTTNDIAGTTDDPLYNTERWATGGGSYIYNVPVANGTYRVELNLAEIYYGITAPGQRVFDILLENQPLTPLQNLDLYAKVGAYTPYTISQLVNVTDGALTIQVGPGSSAAGNVENAKLSAFSIYSEPTTAAATTLSIAATDASKAEGNSGSTPFTFTVTRGGTTTGTSSVNWAVTGSGSAPADATDFGGSLPGGIINFAPGETSKTLTVNVAGDTTSEPNEGFTVTLSGATGGTVTTAAASGTINNDDTAAADPFAGITPVDNYGPSANGAAVISITPGGGIQASNYNSGSFSITNVGDKRIAAVYLDATKALYPDTVFDPFGLAGDTISKPLTIDSDGSTGVFIPTSPYFGAGGTAGYEGAALRFAPTVSGGFSPGETVTFSVA